MNKKQYSDKIFCLEVWGPRACFTRPEFKVERVSYDVITPSAARAIFECIFWKPAIKWEITKIEVINPIKWTSIRRNEIKADAINVEPILIDSGKNRDQRNTLYLKDVRYRLYAKFLFIPQWKRNKSKNPNIDKEEQKLLRLDENPGKYMAIFERRARKGQCFTTPYLGCREFAANWKYIENPEFDIVECRGGNKDLGFMFYDWTYESADKNDAQFFHAIMEDGVINVPNKDNRKEVLR